jgi:hypothetical protein
LLESDLPLTSQVITLVKIPISEIEEWIRTKHDLPPLLMDFRIEEKSLILSFREEEISEKIEGKLTVVNSRRKRSYRKRNRMKTRGWEMVARITNSKGQKCTVYRPFVEALQDPGLPIEEQKKIVERILKANRNRPSEESILYFLGNTLEYLQKQREQSQEKVA